MRLAFSHILDYSCFFQFVPRYWKLSISMWISALSDEFGYIKKWVDMNIDPANEPRLPKELWLPAIIHPKGNKWLVDKAYMCTNLYGNIDRIVFCCNSRLLSKTFM